MRGLKISAQLYTCYKMRETCDRVNRRFLPRSRLKPLASGDNSHRIEQQLRRTVLVYRVNRRPPPGLRLRTAHTRPHMLHLAPLT